MAHLGGTAEVQVIVYSCSGMDILESGFWSDRRAAGQPPDIELSDWRRAEWATSPQDLTRLSDLRIWEKPSLPPPAWSLIADLNTAQSSESLMDLFNKGTIYEVASGWPMRSTAYFAIDPMDSAGFDVRDGVVVASKSTTASGVPRVISLRIYWPGAIANTLLCAAVIFVPVALMPVIRHHRRRRAGRCTACGYDLRGSDHGICPECCNPG